MKSEDGKNETKEALVEKLLRKRVEKGNRSDDCDGCGEQCGCD